MPTKTPDELAEIVSFFEAPELIFDELIEAGPDEKLYLMHDKTGEKYAIWARDNMSALEFETRGLANEQKVKIRKWLPLKDAEDFEGDEQFKHYTTGDWYAVALIG